MGKGLHLGGPNVAGDVQRLVFLRKYNRAPKILCSNACYTDPGCLDGQDFVDPAVMEQTLEFLCHFHKEAHVHLMIQEAVDLENAALAHYAVPADALFQKLQLNSLLFQKDSFIIQEFCRKCKRTIL